MNRPDTPAARKAQPAGTYASQDYWARRSDMLYYRYVDFIVRAVGVDARSMVDVGTGNCPYLEWFDWIPERTSVDIRVPYQSDTVKGVKGDIHKLKFEKRFDLLSCLQVLEHIPDAAAFARRLLDLAELAIISVPYKWPTVPKPTPGHIHDPVDYAKLTQWMGREANYKIIVQEPFGGVKGHRLIALYDRDPGRRFTYALRERMIHR